MDGYYVNNERSPSSPFTDFHTSHLWHITFPNDTERIVRVVSKAMNGKIYEFVVSGC